MATAAEIKTAYKAVVRAELNDTVATSIASSGVSLDTYISGLVSQQATTTGAAVAIAGFVTGKTPTSAKLDELKVAADAQVAAYTKAGVADPALGAFEAFGKGFSETAEFKAKYEALSTADFIGVVYGAVFGANPTAGAAANLTAQIESFTKLYTDAGLADAALQAKGAVLGQIVGYAFTSASANSNLDNQVAAVLTAAAKGDASVYNKALPTVVDPGTVGVTINIAAATDVVSPTSADPAFKSTANNDTIQGTFLVGAKIDGGAGDDTLKVKVGAVETPLAGDITNIETINATVDLAAGAGFNLTNTTGVKTVGFTYGGATVGLGEGTFSNLAAGTALFVTDTDTATATKNVTFSLKTDTTADVAAIALNGVTGSTVTLTGYETVNLTATGANVTGTTLADLGLKALNITATKNVGLTLDSTALESVVATGAGSVNLGVLSDTTKTIDASGLSGATGLTFSIANGNALTSVKASAGADNFTITTTDKALAIDLGAGNDTLVYTQTNATPGSAFGEVNAGAGADNVKLDNTGSATAVFSTQKVTLGAGADKLELVDNGTNVQTTIVYAAGDSTLAFQDQITGFKSGTAATATAVVDKIDLKAFGLTAAPIATSTDLAPTGSVDTLFQTQGTSIIAFDTGADTLVFIDANKNGNFDAGSDLVIKLVGLTGVGEILTADNFLLS